MIVSVSIFSSPQAPYLSNLLSNWISKSELRKQSLKWVPKTHKESWALKNWCFWIVVLEKTLESPLDCKEIKPVSPKRSQPWIFFERTDAEAEALILIHWKRPWCWERLKAKGEGGNWRWDTLIASLTQWTWVWANCEIVKDREAWSAAVHGIAKSWT